MKPITSLTVTDDVSLVTIYNIPDQISALAAVFRRISEAGVNVDMISKASGQKNTAQVSFTVAGSDFAKVVAVAGEYKKRYEGLTIGVNGGNMKLSAYGEAMKELCGVAGELLTVLENAGIEVKLITTSEVDISLLIDENDGDNAIETIKNAFELEI